MRTGGRGTGSGLGSQGALVLSANGRWLFAVNAGSNDISVFEVRGDVLKRTDRIASGGEQPISLTVHDDLVYVLNAGGSGNISGFRLRDNGKLSVLQGSTRALSNGGVGPAPAPTGDVPDGGDRRQIPGAGRRPCDDRVGFAPYGVVFIWARGGVSSRDGLGIRDARVPPRGAASGRRGAGTQSDVGHGPNTGDGSSL